MIEPGAACRTVGELMVLKRQMAIYFVAVGFCELVIKILIHPRH